MLIDRVFPLHNIIQTLPPISYLKQYRHIMVSGPDRSGTTFTAYLLSQLLNYTHVDEMSTNVFSDGIVCNVFCYNELFQTRDNIVSQRPGETSRLHNIRDNSTFIVFMARNCLDVFKSQNKIFSPTDSWTCKYGRREELNKYLNNKELSQYYDYTDMICKIKQDVWKNYQMSILKKIPINFINLDYESLVHNTTLFKPHHKRKHFHSKQIY